MKLAKSEAEIYNFMREIERRHSLYQLEIDGISPWQLIKFETSIAAQKLKLVRRPLSRRLLLFRLLRGTLQLNRRSQDIKYLCKSFDSAYRVRHGANFKDVYFDALIETIHGGAKMSSFDAIGFSDNISAALYPPKFDDTVIMGAGALLARVFPRFRHHPVFDAIEHATSQEGVPVRRERIARVYNTFYWRLSLYRRILQRLKPSVVICADSGQFALMAASKAESIPYIELQHGLTTKVHPNVLPGDLTQWERSNVLVPDHFAVYGKNVAECLVGTLLEKENRIVPVGSGAIEAARAFSQSVRETETDYIVVTFTAQGIATSEVANILSEFVRRTPDHVLLNIKLHPAYDSDKELLQIVFQDNPRVRIFDNKQTLSSYDLIAGSDLHLSISSSCHYDALGLGTPTCVLRLETYESVADIIDTPGVYISDTAEDLVRLVGERIPRVSEAISERYFDRGFATKVEALMALATKSSINVCEPVGVAPVSPNTSTMDLPGG